MGHLSVALTARVISTWQAKYPVKEVMRQPIPEETPRNRRIERRVCALVAAGLGVDVRQISLVSTFKELGADVLDVASILVDVESVFGLQIPDEDARSFTSVGQLVTFLDERLRRTDSPKLQAGETV